MVLIVSDFPKTISDDRALALFKTIALAKTNNDMLLMKMQLTSKQYYSRMSGLMKNGLVKRKNGRYALTAFGKVVYEIQVIGSLRQLIRLKYQLGGFQKKNITRFWIL